MPVYSYTAKDMAGGRRTGTVDAKSEGLAVDLLKAQSLFVISLHKKQITFIDTIMEMRGVSETDLVAFTRQFSTMISAGLPIARTLEVLGEQSGSPKFKAIIIDVLRDVEGGVSLSQAFSRYHNVFSPTYTSLVAAGEASGKLDIILKRLAQTMESERELKAKFKSAMVYPIIVFVAMIGVFVILMVFVIPKLAEMYESLNVDLPGMTKFMIFISNLIVHQFLIILVVLAGIAVFLKWFLSTPEGKNIVSSLVFGLPVFGKINKQKELTSFTRTLSLLISSAIPIVEALNIVGDVVRNTTYKQAAKEAALTVEKGNSLAEYFRTNKIFPPLLGQMAGVGEETGQMDEVLGRVADFLDGETDNAIKGLSSALEPIILVMLGSMVGLLIVSIITPIYKITSSI